MLSVPYDTPSRRARTRTVAKGSAGYQTGKICGLTLLLLRKIPSPVRLSEERESTGTIGKDAGLASVGPEQQEAGWTHARGHENPAGLDWPRPSRGTGSLVKLSASRCSRQFG